MPNSHQICVVCGKPFSPRSLFPLATVRPNVLLAIEKDHPKLNHEGSICQNDLSLYRTRYVEGLLTREKGDLSHLEESVVMSLKQHELTSANVSADFEGKLTPGQRLADKIASFGGSWRFLIIFFSFLVVWMVINAVVAFWTKPFDPFPFILLNLMLSCLAAVQAPVIMMSQNRQESKDRVRSEHDYQVNLKAELEIRHLHEKMDHLLMQQWERLVEIQQVQIELLEELKGRKS